MQLNGSALNVEELNGGTSWVILELSTAAFNLVANAVQLKRTVPLRVGSLDFSRQVFQIAIRNNLAVSAFNFVQPGLSIRQGATLGTASFGAFTGNAVQLAIRNQLSAYAFDFDGQPIGQASSVTFTAATMDFVGVDLAPTRIVALDPATFSFTAQTATPVAGVTLTEEALDFVALDVTPSNAPLGEVVNLDPAVFDFDANTLAVTNTIALDLALFDFVSNEVQGSASMNLTASDLELAPQPVTVLQASVQVLLTTAMFDFVPRSMQLTGISSAGDRKRMLFGVGR